MNHAPTIDANKFNKKAILTARTADICRRIVIRWRKTLFWSITQKALVINEINVFDADKNKTHFQEPPFIEANTAVSWL